MNLPANEAGTLSGKRAAFNNKSHGAKNERGYDAPGSEQKRTSRSCPEP